MAPGWPASLTAPVPLRLTLVETPPPQHFTGVPLICLDTTPGWGSCDGGIAQAPQHDPHPRSPRLRPRWLNEASQIALSCAEPSHTLLGLLKSMYWWHLAGHRQ